MAEITIVLPVFRPDTEYLDGLFTSIASQTFQDFDMVIGDDGDAHETIMSMLPESLVSRTRVVRNAGNKGIFGNLNNAISHAGGQYLQIICQDDIMLPELLAENRRHMSDTCMMVFSGFDAISVDHVRSVKYAPWTAFIPSQIPSGEAANYFLYFGCLPGNLSPVMLDSRLILRAGKFDENYRFAGDFEYWIRASQFTDLYYNKKKLLLIRSHRESAGATLGPYQKYEESKAIYNELLARSTLPVKRRALLQYVHIHMFRMLIIHGLIKQLRFQPMDWKQVWRIFDGSPFSLRKAFISFLQPIPPGCKPLQRMMEIPRN